MDRKPFLPLCYGYNGPSYSEAQFNVESMDMSTFRELGCSLGRGTEPWGHETVSLSERLSHKGHKNVRKVPTSVTFPRLTSSAHVNQQITWQNGREDTV